MRHAIYPAVKRHRHERLGANFSCADMRARDDAERGTGDPVTTLASLYPRGLGHATAPDDDAAVDDRGGGDRAMMIGGGVLLKQRRDYFLSLAQSHQKEVASSTARGNALKSRFGGTSGMQSRRSRAYTATTTG